MEYNPYSEHCKKTQQRIADAETDIAERAANIEWYDQLKIAEVSAHLHTSRLQVKDLERQAVAINAQMSPVQAEIARLNELTPFTFNPMQWFSDERMENKRRLKQQRAQARQ